MKPRVLQVITHLALGGAEQVCFTIVGGLGEAFDFEIFAVNGVADTNIGRRYAEEAAAMNVPVHTGTSLPPKLGGMLTGGMALAGVIKQIKPDLIHVHTEIPEAALATAVFLNPSIKSIPLVRTIHNTNVWHDWPAVGRWCEKRMRHAQIACVSLAALTAFTDGRGLETTPDVIYNGVVAPQSQPARNGRANDVLKMLFAARFEEQKGAHLLPEIVRRVQPPKGMTFDLSIHGSGTHESALRELAQSPPAGWRIGVGPALPGLAASLGDYDLFIMPSLFEGLGLTAVETLMAGLPVVATSAPGLSEVFQFDYPWLAAPGDAESFAAALRKAISERDRWPDVIAGARSFALDRFAVPRMLHGYHDLYDRAMSREALADK